MTPRRLLPILDWLPRYDRSLLRGDVAAGVAVTALIVPKNLGYAGIVGVPLQNGLYAAAAGALIYALFGTSRQISTGPSSSLAAVAGGAVLVAGLGGAQAAELVAAIALATRRAVPLDGAAAHGVDLAFPLQGGDHGVPGRRGRRRGHRRAPQADRHVRCSTSPGTRWRSSGTCLVDCHCRTCPPSTWSSSTSRRLRSRPSPWC